MFRKMRRFGQQVPRETCEEILLAQKRGVLSVWGEEEYPYGVPVDFYYDRQEDKLYFHSAPVGHKIEAIDRHDKVSFCVWNEGYQKEGDWAWNITSVIVFGRARRLQEREEVIRRVRQLGLKYFPTAQDVEEEIQKSGHRVAMLEMTIEHMTGKLVNES